MADQPISIEEAIKLHQSGDVKSALPAYLNALSYNKNNQQLLFLIGTAYCQVGQLRDGVEYLKKYIAVNPMQPSAHNNLGNALRDLGLFDEALVSYDKVVALKPDHAEAFYSRGVILDHLKRSSEALASYDKAVALKPDYAKAFYNRGNLLYKLALLDEALASYDAAVALKPDYAQAYSNRGVVLSDLRRLDEALASYDKAIAVEAGFSQTFYNRGNTLKELKRLDEALASYDKTIELKPDHAEAYANRGDTLNELKRLDEALASYDKAVALKPNYAEAYGNRGNLLNELKRFDEALASYDRAIALKPDYAEAYSNRANSFYELKRLDEALAGYDRAIVLKPDYAEAYANRGNVLNELERFDEALASYDRAIVLKPDYAEAFYSRGVILNRLKRLDEALASYDTATALKPDHADAFYNRGVLLTQRKRLDEALASYDRAIQAKPDHAPALALRIHQRAHICDWSDQQHAFDLSGLGIEGRAVPPFTVLAREDNPLAHLERAKTWARQQYVRARTVAFEPTAAREKLRIGYFSAQFHKHATMHLMAGLFELHDKNRFEIHAFSYGEESQDEMRRHLVANVHEFHDVSGLGDSAVAALARSKAIDIAVDLTGYTRDSRSGIFAYRAAPIQINYLGYPSSMGTDFIDYILVDKIVVPEINRKYFSEKVIYVPNTYFVTDNSREIPVSQVGRAELGLPSDGFVFCCFNNNYKITPVEFDIWMRLLTKVDGGVLWLLKDNAWVEANLRKEAEARGVDAARLVFAERMPRPEHLARHRHADLFLDTFNYNAHTTAVDALWAGLPVVTKLGQGFTARVAGSLLHAIELPELVTDTPAAYEQLALDLATNPDRLASIKAKLAANRLTTPLFDTVQFTRDLERAYQMAHERHAKGLPPDHLQVADVGA